MWVHTMRHYATTLCILFLAAAAAGGQPSGGSPEGGAAGEPGPRTRTARVESRSSVVTVAGRLRPARTATHSAPAAGFIAELFVRPGERVRAGQALLSIGRDIPGESYRPLVVSSRIDGVVSTLALKEGEEVRSGASLATVLDDSSFTLEAAVSDKDAGGLVLEPRAAVAARTAGGATLRGALVGLSPEPDYATGLYTLTLSFPAQPGAVAGAMAFADLRSYPVSGVFIDRDLVVRRFSRSVVWVLRDDGTIGAVEVTLGRAYGDEALVLSGLEPGARYLAQLTGAEREGMRAADLPAQAGRSR